MMENTPWESSAERYDKLLKGMDDLIHHTAKLIQDYESAHMAFAHIVYEGDLMDLMESAGSMKTYEREFMLMYYSLKGQVENLKNYRDLINLMFIKDPLNCPEN